MPIYEYRCDKCGEFEITQRITDAALTKCPTCKKKVQRLISSTSFQLKGSGWYVTDYARKGGGKAAEKSTTGEASSGSSESSTSTSTEAKSTSEAKPKSEAKSASDSKPGKASAAA